MTVDSLQRSYLSATARRAQHYSVSTPLKLNTFCPSHSTLLTLNNLVFNNNEFNTTSIQHYFNSTTLHFNKFSSTISHSTPLIFNNLTFNTTYIQQSHFQHRSHSTILVFNNPCFQHNLESKKKFKHVKNIYVFFLQDELFFFFSQDQ